MKLRESQKCRLQGQYTGKGGMVLLMRVSETKPRRISWYSWTVLVLHVLAILYNGAFTKDV